MHTIVRARPAERERIICVLESLACGLMPDSSRCPECRPALASRCPECTRALSDSRTVNTAIAAVQNAATDAQALTAYRACLLALI